MRTAVDSSVLLRILKREEGWTVWRDAISRASTEGSLLICPVVFAECSVGFASTGVATERFEALQLQFDSLPLVVPD